MQQQVFTSSPSQPVFLSQLTLRQAGAITALEHALGSLDEIPVVNFTATFDRLKKKLDLQTKAVKTVFKQLTEFGFFRIGRQKGIRAGAIYWKSVDGDYQARSYPAFDTSLPSKTITLDADLLGLYVHLRALSQKAGGILVGKNAELTRAIPGCTLHFLRCGLGALIDLGYLQVIQPGGFSKDQAYHRREIRVEPNGPEFDQSHGRRCPCTICLRWFRNGYTLKVVGQKNGRGPINSFNLSKLSSVSNTPKVKNIKRTRVRIFTPLQRTKVFDRILDTIQHTILQRPRWIPLLQTIRIRPSDKIECTRTDYLVAKVCVLFNLKALKGGDWERLRVQIERRISAAPQGQAFALKLVLYYFEHGYLTPGQVAKGFSAIGEKWEIVSREDQRYSTSSRVQADGVFRLPKGFQQRTAVLDEASVDMAAERQSEIPQQLGHYPQAFKQAGTLDKALLIENIVRQAENLVPLGNKRQRDLGIKALSDIQGTRALGPDKAVGRFLIRAFVKYCRGKAPAALGSRQEEFSKKYRLFDSMLEFYIEHGYLSPKQQLCITLLYLEIRMLGSRAVRALERLRVRGSWFQRLHRGAAPNALLQLVEERFGFGLDSSEFFGAIRIGV